MKYLIISMLVFLIAACDSKETEVEIHRGTALADSVAKELNVKADLLHRKYTMNENKDRKLIDSALMSLNRALWLNPEDQWIYGNKMRIFTTLKELDSVRKTAEMMTKNLPELPEGWQALALIADVRGNHPRADSLYTIAASKFKRILPTADDSLKALLNYTHSLNMSGQIAKADSILNYLIEIGYVNMTAEEFRQKISNRFLMVENFKRKFNK